MGQGLGFTAWDFGSFLRFPIKRALLRLFEKGQLGFRNPSWKLQHSGLGLGFRVPCLRNNFLFFCAKIAKCELYVLDVYVVNSYDMQGSAS